MNCGIEIVDTAENGSEGLEKIRMLRPDVVITDIRMGVMDGIELVSHVKEELPYIYSVIVSGYQDFDYAKGALKYGVVDYLLKPVNAGQLKGVLDGIESRLSAEYYGKRVELLRKVLAGTGLENWQAEKYLPFRHYFAAILRKNGLPSRFSAKHGLSGDSIFLETEIPLCIRDKGLLWAVPGRDEHEIVFLFSGENSGKSTYEQTVNDIAGKISNGYHTTVYSAGLFSLREAADVISGLYRTLDNGIVIGRSRVLFSSDAEAEEQKEYEAAGLLNEPTAKRIDFLLSNAMYDELKKEFERLFETWKNEERTQLWIENSLRQILQHAERNSAADRDRQKYNLEYMLDEALHVSASYSELLSNIWNIVERIIERNLKGHFKLGTTSFFRSVQQYIERNISEPLSLQSVCSVFGISQTYLSRLFRKFKKMSFNEYLTNARISKAKNIIEDSPDMPIKDVALVVGYSDPFYFSRVFRSVTGVPPSEYLTNASMADG
jgi:YesN/AraC family two-component response regulator